MRYGQETGIGDVTVSKDDLLRIVNKNRAEHRTTFDAALVKFREKAIVELDAIIAELKAGQFPKHLASRLPRPEEHTADYDRAIRMLTMHTEATIALSEEAYARLVDDDWGWRDAFLSNTHSYIVADEA